MVTAFSDCSTNDLNDSDSFGAAMYEDRITPTTDSKSSKFKACFLLCFIYL